MAMMLPIMVGLQMAISVSELEQGELAMQDSDGKVYAEWTKRQDLKKKALEDVSGGSCTSESQILGFKLEDFSENACIYSSVDGLNGHPIVRLAKVSGELWKPCLVPSTQNTVKCSEED